LKHAQNGSKGTHRWTRDGGRRCDRCGQKRTRMPGTPPLIRLQYGAPYCELCREHLKPGDLVAWWSLTGRGGRKRRAVHCEKNGCHSSCVRAGRALQ
jgi:hypothetical protein